jgi:hypothetical protein
MEFNDVQYEGGDVLVKPAWESSEFFLVHRTVLSERSTYFRAFLAERWSKPRTLKPKEGAPHIWTLYLGHEFEESNDPTTK